MFTKIFQYVLVSLIAVFCLQPYMSGSTVSAANDSGIKELNFVFVHGAAGNPCTPQLLADTIFDKLPEYIARYEQQNPSVQVNYDMINRCYPSDVDVQTWANNISDTLDKHFAGKKNLIFVCHSMGGKSALYAVAHNVGNLADKTAMVVTIDSPIKPLNNYALVGGTTFTDFCRAGWLIQPDQGVCNCVGSYDSSDDGKWVAQNKHWLACIAGESSPLSAQFDYAGFDPYPRDMDDGVVPISAQYADSADVFYYGEHGHSDLGAIPEVADSLANQILTYIFGGTISCSVQVRNGDWQHKAGVLLGTDYWQDTVGDVLGDSSFVSHWNPSLIRWQEWQDVIDYVPPTYENPLRSRFDVTRKGSLPLLTSVVEASWYVPDDPSDCRLYIKTRAAPQTNVQADFNIWVQGRLPEGQQRSRYEMEVIAGTPMAQITDAKWQTSDPRDLTVAVLSKAERPFRWYEAKWRVYKEELRQRDIIDELPVQ